MNKFKDPDYKLDAKPQQPQWSDIVTGKAIRDRAPRESPLKEWWLEQQRLKEQKENVK